MATRMFAGMAVRMSARALREQWPPVAGGSMRLEGGGVGAVTHPDSRRSHRPKQRRAEDGMDPSQQDIMLQKYTHNTQHSCRRALKGRELRAPRLHGRGTMLANFVPPSLLWAAAAMSGARAAAGTVRGYYHNYYGHTMEHLGIVYEALGMHERPVVWLLGDSSLDNKNWLKEEAEARCACRPCLPPPPVSPLPPPCWRAPRLRVIMQPTCVANVRLAVLHTSLAVSCLPVVAQVRPANGYDRVLSPPVAVPDVAHWINAGLVRERLPAVCLNWWVVLCVLA
jgi:hypothetical protein